MNKLLPVRAESLREKVVEQIRTAIIEGTLKPGDHITEKALTDQLNVSRTPIREALILLEREGLVISHPNRGSFVRSFTISDVDTIFSMRTVLENFAAQRTIETFNDTDYQYLHKLIDKQQEHIQKGNFNDVRSTDMAFHRYLIDQAEHPLLTKNWNEIVAQIAALLYLRAEAIPEYDEYLAIRDHEAIVEAYESKNLDRVYAENKRINDRVAGECRFAIENLGDEEIVSRPSSNNERTGKRRR